MLIPSSRTSNLLIVRSNFHTNLYDDDDDDDKRSQTRNRSNTIRRRTGKTFNRHWPRHIRQWCPLRAIRSITTFYETPDCRISLFLFRQPMWAIVVIVRIRRVVYRRDIDVNILYIYIYVFVYSYTVTIGLLVVSTIQNLDSLTTKPSGNVWYTHTYIYI